MSDLKWGILGCGVIANEMAQAFEKMGRKVYGVSSRTQTKTEAFAEKVVQKYEENSFRTTKFSVDLGEDIDLVRFHVYLRREEIGEKEELFQIRYQDGDIILDGINGKR